MADIREEKKLTAAKLKTELAPGRYHDGGNLGLYLRVEANGKRYWIQRTTIRGKRTEMGLGSYPMISLATARAKATECKQVVMQGGNPLELKRKAKGVLTFAQAMELYLPTKLAEFDNEKHAKQWRATLDKYAIPILGAKMIDSIDVADVLKVLKPIWETKTETAQRLRGRIEGVMTWATVSGYRKGDNPARWGGNLAELLAKPSKVAKSENQPAVALTDLPRWWKDLDQCEGMAARALQFLTMCASRSGEVRGMTWDEVDLAEASAANFANPGPIWTIPAERMKASKEHRVPLTKEAVDMLRNLPRMQGSPYVFFAPKGGMLSDMSISAVMRRMQAAEVKEGRPGYLDSRNKRPAVPHGLRSTFRDWAAESGIERDLAEMALAHNVGSEVERAYRRTDMLERRRGLLESWGRYMRREVMPKVVFFTTPNQSAT